MHGLHSAAEFLHSQVKRKTFLTRLLDICPNGNLLIPISIVLVCVVGWFESYTGRLFNFDFDLTPMYLIPITLLAWGKGFSFGLMLSVVATTMSSLLTLDGVFSRHHSVWPVVFNAALDLSTMSVASLMIAEVKYLLDHEKEISRTDHVTGIKNTRSFWETIHNELDRMNRYYRPLTVAYIDIDDFKTVNDRHGHIKGDELLRIVGKVLGEQIRSHDVVARIGGDEFAICFPEADEAASRTIMDRLTAKIKTSMAEAGFSNGLSIGVVTFTKAPDSVEDLVHLADESMYRAKTSGKGQTVYRTI